jgi:hypothetical protein
MKFMKPSLIVARKQLLKQVVVEKAVVIPKSV